MSSLSNNPPEYTRNSGRRRPRRPPPRPNPANLQEAALHYLERHAASTRMVRTVLLRRIRKAKPHYPDLDLALVDGWIAELIHKLVARKILDDAEFAVMRTASLRRQGRSARMIERKLGTQGVAPPDLGGAGEDLAAARLFARKKRLGPWRVGAERMAGGVADGASSGPTITPERRRKDFAAMARAGFSYAVAAAVLGARLEEDESGDLF